MADKFLSAREWCFAVCAGIGSALIIGSFYIGTLWLGGAG